MDDASTVLSAEQLSAAEAALRPAEDDAPLHGWEPGLVPALLRTRCAVCFADHDAEERRSAAGQARRRAARLVAVVEGRTADLPDGRAQEWHGRRVGTPGSTDRPAWTTG